MMNDTLLYEKTFRIRSEHVNTLRFLRTSSLFRLMQEASIAHTTALGFGREKTLDKGLLWILIRQKASIRRMPRYDEEVTLRSWPGDMLHVFFPRTYEFWSGDECLIRAESLWLLMDEKERTMAFPAEHEILIPGRKDGGESLLSPAIRAPKETTAAFSECMTAAFSQTDLNGHINNANYFDLIDNWLFDPQEKDCWIRRPFPTEVDAEYLTEIRPGETFWLRGFTSPGGTYYAEGLSGGPPSDPKPASRPLFRIRERFAAQPDDPS